MNKLLVKRLRNIILKYGELNYIDNLHRVLYLVSQIVYILRMNKPEDILMIHREDFDKWEQKLKQNVYLYRKYKKFTCTDNKLKKEVIDLLLDNVDEMDLNTFNLSVLYEKLLTETEKKELGQVYTPQETIDLMIDDVFDNVSVDENFTVIDPACGGGYFLLEIIKRLRTKLNMDIIDDIDRYVVENIVYGADIDEFSCFLTSISIFFLCGCKEYKLNVFNCDFLDSDTFAENKFDAVIGNPPYIGHKKLEKDYKELLKKNYDSVFYDKSDISYCFFPAAKKLLKNDGVICFITSRYFLEALYADKLRSYISEQFDIVKLFDYNGYRIFKNAIVSPVIILLSNKKSINNEIIFNKFNGKNDIITYIYQQSMLGENAWRFLSDREQHLYDKIKSQCNCKLSDIGYFKQGIITGCDKAFIVTEKEIEEYHLETELLRRWIKNSHISKNGIEYRNLYVIYSNLIENEDDYPNTIAYLKQFKPQLMKRRECLSGVRKWYELQWGRNLELFENSKIIFPYKAKSNTFYNDNEGYLCSADIYLFVLENKQIDISYLTNYLNSGIFEFYFKCNGKKVGESLYEYYPNKLENLEIYIPSDNNYEKLTNYQQNYIEKSFEKLFNITGDEKDIINHFIVL